MSRRKQACPVRIEGNRPLQSVEAGSSCSQKSKEPVLRTVLPDECNLNISAEAAHLKSPNILSNGESIPLSECNTDVLAYDEESYSKSETKPGVLLPPVTTEPLIVHNEEKGPLVASCCNSSSSIVKEEDTHTSPVDQNKQCESVVHKHKVKSQCLLHNSLHCGCVEVEKNVEIHRDLNVRTSLVCKTGTEIKIVQNASSEKVEVHCVTNRTANTFGIHKKQVKQVKRSPHKNHEPETEDQREPCAKEENFLESEEHPVKTILSCDEVNQSFLNEEPEPLIISSCTGSIPVIKETGFSTFSIGETEQLGRIISTLEPNSDAILLDEHDLNTPVGDVCARSPSILSNGELIEPGDVFNEPETNVLTCDEPGFLKNEAKHCIVLPSVKTESLEPAIALSEEPNSFIISAFNDSACIKKESFCTAVGGQKQCDGVIDMQELKPVLPSVKIESLEPAIVLNEEPNSQIISAFNDSSCAKKESFCTAVGEQKQCDGATDMQELKPLCLYCNLVQCDCKEVEGNTEACGDLNVRTSSIDKARTEFETIQNLCVEKVEEQSATRFAENTFKVGKKQHQKSRRSRKNHALETVEQGQACTELEIPVKIEESPLHAILPCVDVDPSLFKEEPEPFISSCKEPISITEETDISSFPVCERIISEPDLKPLCLSPNPEQSDCNVSEQNVEACGVLDVDHSLMCDSETETEIFPGLCAEKEEGRRAKRYTRKRSKVRRKRPTKARKSVRKNRVSKSAEQSQVHGDRKSFLGSGKSQLQAILPCSDVDSSLLKGEPAVISSCEDSVSTSAERSLLSSPASERKRRACNRNTRKLIQMCLQSDSQHGCEEAGENSELSNDSIVNDFVSRIPRTGSSKKLNSCVTDEEIRCMVDFTKEALGDREKKLQQIREAVYRKRSLETEEQRQARLEKDKLRQRKRRAEETEEQREKRLLTMRLHKRIKRSMHSATGLQKNFLDYYMEEMFKYPETQEEQGSPLNMIVSIDPTWVLRTVEKQQFRCAVETEEQRRVRLEKDMLRQRKKRAEETTEQRAKRLETMRINKRIRRAMETEDQRHRRLEYSRERQLYRRLNETEEQRKERLEREKLRQRQKRATESAEERALRLQGARERMRMRLPGSGNVSDTFDNLLSSDSLSS